jgi:hypothetical protein
MSYQHSDYQTRCWNGLKITIQNRECHRVITKMSTSVKSQTFEYSVMIFDGQNDTVWSSLTVSIDRISCTRAGLYTKKSNWC